MLSNCCLAWAAPVGTSVGRPPCHSRNVNHSSGRECIPYHSVVICHLQMV